MKHYKTFDECSNEVQRIEMSLIQEYTELAKICSSTDYADKKSVRLHNKCIDRMYEIAEKIGSEQTTDTIVDFAKLLDITENKTNVWVAVHILERIPVNKTIEEKALQIIKRQTETDSANAMGFKIWLDNYKRK
jgi:hypothetical protein